MDQRDYIARVNRVIDHIRLNLDTELSLETLAAVASFSPFHFHRIFKVLVGENLNDFVRRLRLEKAAGLLRFSPHRPVTEIALDCGFSSASVFARAFKQHFGVSASDYRSSRGNGEPAGDSRAGRLGPDGRLPEATGEVGPGRRFQVEIEQLPALRVAYIRHLQGFEAGVYSAALDHAFDRVAKWLFARDLMTRDTLCVGILHDNVGITPNHKRAYDASFTVPPHVTQAGGEVGLQEIPAARYAVCRIAKENPDGTGQRQAIEELGQAASYLYGTWLPTSGYELADQPALEIYPSNRPVFQVDFYLPVRPL